jgi:hypothetical protein
MSTFDQNSLTQYIIHRCRTICLREFLVLWWSSGIAYVHVSWVQYQELEYMGTHLEIDYRPSEKRCYKDVLLSLQPVGTASLVPRMATK